MNKKEKLMIKAVIFDLDGVLINSEKFMIDIYDKFIHHYNLALKREDFYIMIGGNKRMNHLHYIYELMPEPKISETEFRTKLADFKDQERKNFNFNTIVYPEVKSAIRRLHDEGYKIVCASSSPNDHIDRALSECEIKEYFDIIVSGLDFKESKPNPEIYNHCVEKLALDKSECVIVEDSPYGIKAANNAHIYVYARRDNQFGMDQSGADCLIDNLNEVIELIKEK